MIVVTWPVDIWNVLQSEWGQTSHVGGVGVVVRWCKSAPMLSLLMGTILLPLSSTHSLQCQVRMQWAYNYSILMLTHYNVMIQNLILTYIPRTSWRWYSNHCDRHWLRKNFCQRSDVQSYIRRRGLHSPHHWLHTMAAVCLWDHSFFNRRVKRLLSDH